MVSVRKKNTDGPCGSPLTIASEFHVPPITGLQVQLIQETYLYVRSVPGDLLIEQEGCKVHILGLEYIGEYP